MCLNYGTPYRFYEALALGVPHPIDCKSRVELRALLGAELEAGVYANPDLFDPRLARLLEVLFTDEERLPPSAREPSYPFCDLIQGVALAFGLQNAMDYFLPPPYQGCVLAYGWQAHGLSPASMAHFAMLRDFIRLLPPHERQGYAALEALAIQRAGLASLLAEAGARMVARYAKKHGS